MNVKRKEEYKCIEIAESVEKLCEEFIPTKEELKRIEYMKIKDENELKIPSIKNKKIITEIAIWIDWSIRALERYYTCDCGGKLVITRKTGSWSQYRCVNCKKSWEYNHVTCKAKECKSITRKHRGYMNKYMIV